MTPQQFIEKWKNSTLGERQAAHSHFNDLCSMLGVENPTDADPKGEWYCFERGARKTTGGKGWADVWKKDHFGWEYKGKHKDLGAAFAQLQQYAVALENPPLLVVCDTEEIRIHTNWNNTVSETHVIQLEELADLRHRTTLKAIFDAPEKLKPNKTRDALTAEMAERFAGLAKTLTTRGHNPELVAHFLNRLIFCMYAEDADLLPNGMVTRMLNHSFFHPEEFNDLCGDLFRAMQKGGRIGFETVDWFNGNLFDDDLIVPLNRKDIGDVRAAAEQNWKDIDPSILGTLFERGLDPDKRGELGAHYTDREKIMLIIKPVIRRPLQAEWKETREKIAVEMDEAAQAKSPAAAKKHKDGATKLHQDYIDKLAALRVLDPACGSGNFLYLALRTLKDLEHKANLEAEELGLKRGVPRVGPEVVKGIEISPYAAELARVSVWIGELQWMKRHGYDVSKNPILKPLQTIENRDALLNSDGSEAHWPEADFIIGNPPFLGNKKMIRSLGESYVRTLRRAYEPRVTGGADFVTYWFEKARANLVHGGASRCGLVATNSIRAGQSRSVLDSIVSDARLINVWTDQPWIVAGAAVRVSLISFTSDRSEAAQLNGRSVSSISSDLEDEESTGGRDLTKAEALLENKGLSYMGVTRSGPFEVEDHLVAEWCGLSGNPNQKPNSDVLAKFWSGRNITKRGNGYWAIDFDDLSQVAAAEYEAPYERALEQVKPFRSKGRDPKNREIWWKYERSRPDMRRKMSMIHRYIATPKMSKHRFFVWLDSAILPDNLIIVVLRDDDVSFGVLSARFHEVWSLRLGQYLGVGDDPTYTPTSTFETYPFPIGLTPSTPAKDYANDKRAIAIAEAGKKLNELREAWLNPSDLVKRVPDVVPGYPDRILPKDAKAEKELKKRTLTNLYNARPAWLANAHKALDEAVAAAYGWPADLSDDEILKRLFELNQERAKRQAQ